MTIGAKYTRLSALRLSGALALACAIGAPSLALADDQVEEIIVTAQRRSENIQNVPIAVTALSGERLSSIFDSGQDIRALAARVPSLYAESSNGRVAPRFYIRGLGNSDFDLAASQPVSIIMDDIVMENTVLKSSPLFDIQNVEVSRGPQGTLFGRNTTAGIVKFTSVKPSDKFEANGSVSYGTYDTFNFEGGVGGAIVPGKLSFRVSALVQDRSDYINNFNGVTEEKDALGGYRERAGRVQLLLTPTDNLSVLLNVHGRSINGTAAVFRANIFTKGSNSLNSNYIKNQTFFDGGGGNPQKYNGYGTTAKIEYKFPGVTLTSITGFETTQGASRGDIDGGNFVTFPTLPFPSDTQDGLDHLGQLTQEIHLAKNSGGKFFWQAGVYYFDSDLRITTLGPPAGVGFPPPTPVRQTNDAYSAFGQASYQFTDKFTLTAGVRYTRDNKKLTSISSANARSVSADNTSWDVSGSYKLTPDVNLYARVATGFRAPSIQGRNIAFFAPPSVARSETITSFEGGVKSELFDRKVRLNADGFYYTINNMQLTAIGGAGNLNQLINADSGRAWGFELDGEARITQHFLMTAGLSYTNTKIRSAGLTTGACGGGCTITDALSGGNPIIDGNPFPQAPEVIASVTARYGIPVGTGGELFVFTDWTYQGYTNFFLYQSKEFFTDGNFEGGLRLGYTRNNGGYEIAVFARNITDEQNVQGGIDFNNLTGFVSDPRVFGVSLSAKFN